MAPFPEKWRLIERSHSDPYINFAIDEAIGYQVGKEGAPATIRIWEPKVPAVYIGLGQDIEKEVDLEACVKDKIVVIRRHSGGGAVYAGPGVLYVSIALRLQEYPELNNIKRSYKHLSGLLTGVLKKQGFKASMQGTSDLTIGKRKVAGQAQARKYGALLHQTSLIFDVDLKAMEKYLAMPSKMPAYRGKRAHSDFVTMLGKKKMGPFISKLKSSLKGTARNLSKAELENARDLALKYQDETWTIKKQKGKGPRPTIKIARG